VSESGEGSYYGGPYLYLAVDESKEGEVLVGLRTRTLLTNSGTSA